MQRFTQTGSKLLENGIFGATPAVQGLPLCENLESRQFLSVTNGPVPPVTALPKPPIIVIHPIVGKGVTISPEATDAFHGNVGLVEGYLGPTAGVKAEIDWGDGKHSLGMIVPAPTAQPGAFNPVLVVIGDHVFAKAGKFNITIQVTRGPVGKSLQPTVLLTTIHSTANVRPDEDGGVSLVETATQKFTAKVGSFDYRNVDLKLTARIEWGDGSTSVGTIQGNNATGEWDVIGTHTYKTTGIYKVKVNVFAAPIGGPGPQPQFIIALSSWTSTIKVMGRA